MRDRFSRACYGDEVDGVLQVEYKFVITRDDIPDSKINSKKRGVGNFESAREWGIRKQNVCAIKV